MYKEYDYYSVQREVDGFGNDTYTEATFKTKEECEKYIAKKYKRENKDYVQIVGQRWGKYENVFE